MWSPFLFISRRPDRQKELPFEGRGVSLPEKTKIPPAPERSTGSISQKKVSTNIMITTEQIKELRDQTGVSIMQCKKALEEAGGDMAKATVILRKKGGELAAKKHDRTFGAGV